MGFIANKFFKVLAGIILGAALLFAFFHFGGTDALKKIGAKTEDVGEALERYEDDVRGAAEKVREIDLGELGEDVKKAAKKAKATAIETKEKAAEAIEKTGDAITKTKEAVTDTVETVKEAGAKVKKATSDAGDAIEAAGEKVKEFVPEGE